MDGQENQRIYEEHSFRPVEVCTSEQQNLNPGNPVPVYIEDNEGENQNPNIPLEINTGLGEYLNCTARGKEILKEYNNNDHYLPKNTRSKLVRLVVQREKDWQLRDISADEQIKKFEISSNRFKILAKEIVSLFNNEYECTYYTPFKKEGKSRVPASGKLWDHFNYEKDRLRQVGLLASRNRGADVQNPPPVATIEGLNNLEYLKISIDDWDTVQTLSKEIYDLRRNQLTLGISTADYISNFLCLQVEKGLELIEYDFTKLHPNKKFVSSNEWAKIKSCIQFNLENKRRTLSAETQGLIFSLANNGLNSDQQDFISLYLLPHVVSSQRSRKRRSSDDVNIRPLRLSTEERRETFILHVHTPADIQKAVRDLQEKLKNRGETFQPVIVAVGQLSNIAEYFIVINDEYYKKPSILEAVELAFKIIFALDCKYPESSNTLWLFVQKCLFNIHLPQDLNNVSLHILIGHITEKLKA